MRVIIAGSRTINDYERLVDAIYRSRFDIGSIITGGARGVDFLGKRYAKENKIPHIEINANWKDNGPSAGFVRNIRMASAADALIALWDGKSTGTSHMIRTARRFKLKVYIESL